MYYVQRKSFSIKVIYLFYINYLNPPGETVVELTFIFCGFLPSVDTPEWLLRICSAPQFVAAGVTMSPVLSAALVVTLLCSQAHCGTPVVCWHGINDNAAR